MERYEDIILLFMEMYDLTREEATIVAEAYRDASEDEDIEYEDNFRHHMGDINLKEYNQALDNGCCGFYDEDVTLPSGKVVTFGFNHGH